MNLCDDVWDLKAARLRADSVGHRRAVLLGRRVAEAFGVRYYPFEVFDVNSRLAAASLPHPSGRCRAWNEVGSAVRARRCLAALEAL